MTLGTTSRSKAFGQIRWQRITLLTVLGCEAAGAIAGGGLLIAAPDGSLMNMPVDMMHGIFPDFLVPGIILFGLGLLNALAFASVLRRSAYDWIMAGLALGGMAVWFITEIIILQELHWLHLVWGFPVFLGIVAAIPLIADRWPAESTLKVLLACGILSSLWYIAINIYIPLRYEGYSFAVHTVSELSALGAPTRELWVLSTMPYAVLFTAFGWGVMQAAAGNRALRVTAWLIIAYCIFNFYWPPMHMRGSEPSLTDTLHITWAAVTLFTMLCMMGFGAAALGRRFRIYTAASVVVFIVFGALIGIEAPGIQANLPTPHLGIWERINMGAFFLWTAVFASALLQIKKAPSARQ
jgi:hypothetical protein